MTSRGIQGRAGAVSGLRAAERMLMEPARAARGRMLVAVNLSVALGLVLNLGLQLAEKGSTNNPALDAVLFPIIITFMIVSAVFVIRERSEKAVERRTFFARVTVVVLVGGAMVLLHAHPEPALALLFDVWIAPPVIFTAALLLGRRAGLAAAVILLGNVGIAAWRLGFGYRYDTLVIDPPTSLASFLIVFAAYAVVSTLVAYYGSGLTDQMLALLPRAANRIRRAVRGARELELENARMGAELETARRVQTMVLPTEEEFRACAGCEIAAVMLTAREVGGDYYDVIRAGRATYIGIGDVTDHGLESGVVMLMVQSALRTLLDGGRLSPREALRRVNAIVYKNNLRGVGGGRTMTLSILRYEEGKVSVGGQHESILIRRSNGRLENVETLELGMYVGLIEDIEPYLKEAGLELGAGDEMLLYTDGVTEAEDARGEAFGMERLSRAFLECGGGAASRTVAAILERVRVWMGARAPGDDVSLLVLRRT